MFSRLVTSSDNLCPSCGVRDEIKICERREEMGYHVMINHRNQTLD